jgi:hypothetical protein
MDGVKDDKHPTPQGPNAAGPGDMMRPAHGGPESVPSMQARAWIEPPR